MKRLSRRMKTELATAVIVATALAFLAFYANRPVRYIASDSQEGKESMFMNAWGTRSPLPLGGLGVQEVVVENINGELRKGTFETVISGFKNLTFYYDGRIPVLTMVLENELWTGRLDCKVPTENVTWFAFDSRKLIASYGSVTYISISSTETLVNTTQPQEEPLSEVTISLKEIAGGFDYQVFSQIGTVVPWLVTGLVWIAQGLIVGLPLCFASLGIVVLVDRGIVPAWKKQFKNRSLTKGRPEQRI